MNDKQSLELLSSLLEDDTIRYHNEYTNNICICMILERHLSKEDLDYIYYNWKAFYKEPIKYMVWKNAINECLDELQSSRRESE